MYTESGGIDQIPYNLSCREMQPFMWVLATEFWSFEKEMIVLNNLSMLWLLLFSFKNKFSLFLMHLYNTSGQCHQPFSSISLTLLFFTVLFLMFLSICFSAWPTEFKQGHYVTTGLEVFIAAWFAEQWVTDWRQWHPHIQQPINSQMLSC